MSGPDRLFLFAGYDKDNLVAESLVYYVQNLSKYGDVIVCLDNDCAKSEIQKLKPYTIHTITGRHEEYDFGSYKRCFKYAHDKNILKNYNEVYLVNDSVFGPLFNMEDILKNIKETQSDACGIVITKHQTHSYMESWFIKLNKKIFMSDWFYKFMSEITKQKTKNQVTIKYEHGLTNLIRNNDCSYDSIYKFHGRFTYNNPKYLFKHGCPFIKRASFIRHNGSTGLQLQYILNHADKAATKAIMTTTNRIYGKKYIDWLLTYNPIKILYRTVIYTIQKIKNGGI